MTPKQIRAAMLQSGCLWPYSGQLKTEHEDGARLLAGFVHAPQRCEAWTTDDMGTSILKPNLCRCGVGEWLVRPTQWALELLELLNRCPEDQ